jgi:lipoate-protein ligase A
VRVWANPPAVIVGRFQEVIAEVDVDLCQQRKIEIARRFTGGGTVFHDGGNLNLSIVTGKEEGTPLTKFHAHNCAVISNLLGQLGVESSYVPPNSIEISGKKVSGAAAAMGRDFAFWHASILISTDTSLLKQVLLPSQSAKSTKFIRSRWQEVTTLDSALGKQVELEDIKHKLVRSCERSFGVSLEAGRLSEEEDQLMRALYANKYSSREWTLHGWTGESGFQRNGETHTTIAV